MKWCVIQPLAGGMALGAKNAIGNYPEFILSQRPFEFNDSFLLDYWKDKVPYYFLEDSPVVDYSDMDLVISVPVCAGLSQLNSSKTRGSDAPQNDNMLFNAKHALEIIKPKVFIFENAPALFTSIGAGVVEKLKELATKNSYSFTLYKTDTLKHGIPQKRRRTFAMFWKDSNCPVLEYCDKRTTLKEYFSKIDPSASYQDKFVEPNILDSPYFDYIKNHADLKHRIAEFEGLSFISIISKHGLLEDFAHTTTDEKAKANALRIDAKLKDGKNYWDHTPFFLKQDYVGAIQGRLYGRTIYTEEMRDLSIREIISLMGHPDDYELKNDPIKNLSVIGQNVPVKTAQFITSQAVKFINGELPLTDQSFTKQDNTKEQTTEIASLSAFF